VQSLVHCLCFSVASQSPGQPKWATAQAVSTCASSCASTTLILTGPRQALWWPCHHCLAVPTTRHGRPRVARPRTGLSKASTVCNPRIKNELSRCSHSQLVAAGRTTRQLTALMAGGFQLHTFGGAGANGLLPPAVSTRWSHDYQAAPSRGALEGPWRRGLADRLV
jgi:hypothetical protein